jgi:anhydro-N-acetylmuramic acid kinase
MAVQDFCAVKPDLLVVGGGGCRNATLMRGLREELSIPVLTNEDLGLDSDAKEAVAFAILANECIHGHPNNLCTVTGAAHPVVMGKISI